MPLPLANRKPTTPKASDKQDSTDHSGLDWDSPISPGEAFKVIPSGLGTFKVTSFKRGRKDMGSLGNCPVAIMDVVLTHGESGETCKIEENLPLHPKVMFKLFQFFTAIGQREHGDTTPLTPDWTAVEGSEGYCLIGHREWEKKDKTMATSNQVTRYLSQEDAEEEDAKVKF